MGKKSENISPYTHQSLKTVCSWRRGPWEENMSCNDKISGFKRCVMER